MKSKNKLVPRLLGITKESVMRVDEKTKDVVQEWPLTTVKRWAASPKSFTLVRATFSTFKPKTCSTFITESRSSEYFSNAGSVGGRVLSFIHSVCTEHLVANAK